MPSLERDAFGMATHYEDDIIHAIVQSPTALYVYWELSELSKQLLETHYHTSFDSFRKELRVIDVTLVDYEQGQANRTYQFELLEMTNAWFVRPITPNTTYIIEWGIQTIDGDFVPVLRSKPVETPRDEAVTDGRFAEVVQHWQYGEVEQPNGSKYYVRIHISIASGNGIRERERKRSYAKRIFFTRLTCTLTIYPSRRGASPRRTMDVRSDFRNLHPVALGS
ncbi:DUF4912 domain-containing protein [Exiguobacterium sp. SL14]|nr:DUF4912 domain-containing protein [Exiguobacterium sp. SL14]MCY1691908.1 DUF4912 domain-containing protein [Exiguobacterium sp. SL14]